MTATPNPSELAALVERLREFRVSETVEERFGDRVYVKTKPKCPAVCLAAAAALDAMRGEMELTRSALDVMNTASLDHDADLHRARMRAEAAEQRLREIAEIAGNRIAYTKSGPDSAMDRILALTGAQP